MQSKEVPRRAIARAADDLNSLATVFDWLEAMFAVIGSATDSNQTLPEARLNRIKTLAECARYLASDWEEMARCMAEAHAETAEETNRV